MKPSVSYCVNECTICYDYQTDSESGFCDYEMMINTTHGDYNWTETKAQNNATLECFHEPTVEAGDDGRARRKCNGSRMWLDYYGDECTTVITFRFRQLANVRFFFIAVVSHVKFTITYRSP